MNNAWILHSKILNKKDLMKSHITIHIVFYDIQLILWGLNFANNLCISPKKGYLTYDNMIKIGPTNVLFFFSKNPLC
jgi:hypothetical protein